MKKPARALLAETALCLLLSVLPHLLAFWPQDIMTVLSIFFSHVFYPVAALFLPLLAARRGAEAFLCTLPPFLMYLITNVLTGVTLPALPTILTLLFSVLGASIGAELKKRDRKE